MLGEERPNFSRILARALTSLQLLQVRGESCIGICQRGKAQVPEVENGGEQREHRVDLLVGRTERKEEVRATKCKYAKCAACLNKKQNITEHSFLHLCMCKCVLCLFLISNG